MKENGVGKRRERCFMGAREYRSGSCVQAFSDGFQCLGWREGGWGCCKGLRSEMRIHEMAR